MDWKKLYHFIEWWTDLFYICQIWAKMFLVFVSYVIQLKSTLSSRYLTLVVIGEQTKRARHSQVWLIEVCDWQQAREHL